MENSKLKTRESLAVPASVAFRVGPSYVLKTLWTRRRARGIVARDSSTQIGVIDSSQKEIGMR